jgi:D-aminopeptidase
MRILLQADMDGIATIGDHRELVTLWPHYWRDGRAKLNAEISAAASGLLDGGAAEVVVFDGHGSGVPNFDPEHLPDRTRVVQLTEALELRRMLREGAFDAILQVGRHPRTGTNDGFMPHTQELGLALAIDGRPVTECHLLAFSAQVPVLGIIGDAKLAPQIDGILAGTPYLATKRGISKGASRPVHDDPARGNAAVRAFARQAIGDWKARTIPRLPESFTFSACLLNSQLTALAVGQAGLRQESPSVLSVVCEDWLRDAVPAMYAAMSAARQPGAAAADGLSITTEAHIDESDPRLLAARSAFDAWLQRPDREWQA